MLVMAYRGAVESRWRKRCYVMAKVMDPSKSAYGNVLTRAVELFQLYEIAPAAWAAWSVDCWRAMGHAAPPAIRWVFAPARIEERVEWFQNEEGAYKGGRVVLCALAQDVVRRYSAMKLDMCRRRARTPEEVAAVVELYFPNGSFDRVVADAREHAADDQRRMNDMMARGEWLSW